MDNELEELKTKLKELKELRDKLSKEEIEDTSTDIREKKEESEEATTDIRKSAKEELDEIDKQIKIFEDDIKQTAKAYEESYNNLKGIIDEYVTSTEDTRLQSDEEINSQREKFETLKLEENERSNEIKRRLDAQKKIIRQLKSKKTRLEKNIANAEALELTYSEYKNITATLRKTSIMNKILEEKGLTAVIEKKTNERTQEEKDLLKKAKQEILNEVSEFKKEHDDYSVLDSIEALYSLDTKYIKVEPPRITTATTKELMIVNDGIQGVLHKVINPNVKVSPKVVEEIPKDMENATTNESIDFNELKPAEEKVTIFNENGNYYVRKYTVDRFKIKTADLDNEVRINGSLCYRINEKDVERIKENANNTFSPYIADIKEINLENITTNGIPEEDTKAELIPGTNIKRPRDRKPYETDEEYEAFIKNYYDKVFPQSTNKDEILPNTTETALVALPKDEIEEIEEYVSTDTNIEKIVIYKENDRYYVRAFAVDRFKLKSVNKAEPVDIEGSRCYEISKEEFEKLQNNKDNSFSPYKIELEEVKEEIEELSVEDVNEVVDEKVEEHEAKSIVETENKENLEEKLKASNIVATDEFKKELKKGSVLYNIVHKVPKAITNILIKFIQKAEDFFEKANDMLTPSVAGTKMYTDDLPRYIK